MRLPANLHTGPLQKYTSCSEWVSPPALQAGPQVRDAAQIWLTVKVWGGRVEPQLVSASEAGHSISCPAAQEVVCWLSAPVRVRGLSRQNADQKVRFDGRGAGAGTRPCRACCVALVETP